MSQEIIIAIVGVITTALITGFGKYIRSRQGNRILIARTKEVDRYDISYSEKKRLELRYKTESSNELFMNRLEIFNQGNETIQGIELKIISKPKDGSIKFLDITKYDPLDKTQVSQKGNTISFTRPFLNHKKAYPEEVIDLIIYANTRLEFKVEGGGPGWYTRFQDVNRISRVIDKFGLLFYIFILYSSLLVAYPDRLGFLSSPIFAGIVLTLGVIYGVAYIKYNW